MALPADRNIDTSKFPEKVRRFLDPAAPPQLRMMVARGMVPMPPVVQVCALYQLQLGDDPEVRRAANESLGKLGPASVRDVAAKPIMAVVLDWLADRYRDQAPVLRAILQNANTDGETFVRLARQGDEGLIEMLALNQQRLLSTPGLIQAIYLNRHTRASTADRVADFGIRNNVDLSDLPCYEELVAAIRGSEPLSAEEQARADEIMRAATAAALHEEETETAEALPDPDLESEEPEEPEVKKRMSAAGRIRDLNIAQKVRLAMMGTKSERAILIRDSNKIVSRAVIRSPAVSDGEALSYAAHKSLPDEVVAFMSRNKKWIRHYQFKKAMVYNPKTPLGESLRFLRALRPGDLRAVARSRSVPGPVNKAAKQLLKARLK